MNEIIPMPVIVEGEEYDYCEEESAAEVIGSLLAGVDGMEWKDDTLIKHTTSADVPVANFIPVPVEDIIYDNGAERSRFFRVKGLQSRNGKLVELPVVRVDSNDNCKCILNLKHSVNYQSRPTAFRTHNGGACRTHRHYRAIFV